MELLKVLRNILWVCFGSGYAISCSVNFYLGMAGGFVCLSIFFIFGKESVLNTRCPKNTFNFIYLVINI